MKTNLYVMNVVYLGTGGTSSRPMGRRYLHPIRARRVVRWLKARGHDAYTVTAQVRMTAEQYARLNW